MGTLAATFVHCKFRTLMISILKSMLNRSADFNSSFPIAAILNEKKLEAKRKSQGFLPEMLLLKNYLYLIKSSDHYLGQKPLIIKSVLSMTKRICKPAYLELQIILS